MVSRSGVIYEITSAGLGYLEQLGTLLQQTGRESATRPQTEIRRLLKTQQDEVRARIHETLANMEAYELEHLIKRLLEAMEYENVEVTKRSHDGGVDVVADIEVGITPVREVVQVKRRSSNIQRPTLDELRGSLHRFDAMRGTIITVGGFSSGARSAAFERGAAPITLIDGERLIDLLIEHEIGVRKRAIQLIEFEPGDFAAIEVEE
jgi:restriction system protein